jgi:hypothetical protein
MIIDGLPILPLGIAFVVALTSAMALTYANAKRAS